MDKLIEFTMDRNTSEKPEFYRSPGQETATEKRMLRKQHLNIDSADNIFKSLDKSQSKHLLS
jgi:hypothetical protein